MDLMLLSSRDSRTSYQGFCRCTEKCKHSFRSVIWAGLWGTRCRQTPLSEGWEFLQLPSQGLGTLMDKLIWKWLLKRTVPESQDGLGAKGPWSSSNPCQGQGCHSLDQVLLHRTDDTEDMEAQPFAAMENSLLARPSLVYSVWGHPIDVGW